MLRVAICCGGGFSSSTMAEHLNKQLKAKGLEDKVFLEFIPFANLYGDDSAFITGTNRDRQDEVDVALLCPHLEFDAKRAVAANKLHIPIFLLPMRLYGLVDVENLIEEAEGSKASRTACALHVTGAYARQVADVRKRWQETRRVACPAWQATLRFVTMLITALALLP